MRMEIGERFWSKVKKSNGCWEWLASRSLYRGGYGQFGIGRNVLGAHRVAYEIANGPIPKGLQIDHLCRNRGCVNPDHLEAVTQKENLRRGFSPTMVIHRSGKCMHGHMMTKENTYVRKDTGGRACRECDRNKKRADIKTIAANCSWCGAEFSYRKIRRARSFCGNRCRQESNMNAYILRQQTAKSTPRPEK